MKRSLSIISAAVFFIAAFALAPHFVARAAGLTVSPAVIDDHGLPHDILNYNITLTNTDDHSVIVFASVYNLTSDGKQAFTDTSVVDNSLDQKSVSLANWISVSRASMTFEAGETKTIPVTVNVNPFAVASIYHAVIAFVEGPTRAIAESHLDGAPQTLLNLDVKSNAREDLRLSSFAPVDRFSSAFPVKFDYSIRNAGTVTSTPMGSIIFYDHLGHQIGTADANPQKVAIAPGDTHQFSATLGDGQGFGQYKAMLDLTYGASENSLQEVALVWILPWQKLAVIFSGLLAVVIVLATLVHRSYEKRHLARETAIRGLLAGREMPQPWAAAQEEQAEDHVVDLRRHNHFQ